MADIVEMGKDLELVNNYKVLARRYGLFSMKKAVPQPGGEVREYLIFSIFPIQEDVNPVAIVNRNERNANIFYPDSFAVELGSENPLLMWERISNYLGYAQLICELYNEYATPIPKSIRVDELEELSHFYIMRDHPGFDEETKKDYQKGLDVFFDNENPKSKFKKEWLEFFRSELYDKDKSFLQNFVLFLRRNEPETSLDTLMESNGDLNKVYMPEHHYKEFRELIKKRYPGVKFFASEVQVVDKGVIVDPATGKPVQTPYGITVTEEEYEKIKRERFSDEGHECLEGLNPSYFEGRDVVYKACDENIIASVSNELNYRWAKCSDLESLLKNGDVCSVDIPKRHMMNFYTGMKEAGIPIHLDFDVNNNPNFKTVRVVYNSVYDDYIRKLLLGFAIAQVSLAHISVDNQDAMFDIDVHKVDGLVQQARARALQGGVGTTLMIEGNDTDKAIDSPFYN